MIGSISLSLKKIVHKLKISLFGDFFEEGEKEFSRYAGINFELFFLDGDKLVDPLSGSLLCYSNEVEEEDDKLLVVLLEDVIDDLGRKFVLEVLVKLVGFASEWGACVPDGGMAPVGGSNNLFNPLHIVVHSVLH